jgi:putative RNA 2'-phosphotransferase
MDNPGEIDPIRLSKTMAFLLRHRPEAGNLRLDAGGWVEVDALLIALTRLLQTQITRDRLLLLTLGPPARFEIVDARIRAVERPLVAHPRVTPPDILFFATVASQLPALARDGLGRLDGADALPLSDDEGQTWRIAHRLAGANDRPAVVVVDAARGRRRGLRFYRNRRNGLFLTPHVPPGDLLNLLPGFAGQLSAGGIPFVRGPDGALRFALIRVTRRSGTTWEVAKGKLEAGEPPEVAGAREVQEEMGLDCPLAVAADLGAVKYGFLAPGGLPRLKTVFLYLFACEGDPGDFRPAEGEGIHAVRWFTLDEACRAVTHSSLQPAMRRAREIAAGWSRR